MMMMMDRCPPLRMKLLPLILLLLKSTCLRRLQADPHAEFADVDYGLECLNDYLFTINCSLSISLSFNASASNTTYWLKLTDTMDKNEYKCQLQNSNGSFFCSVNRLLMTDDEFLEQFSDMDVYEIYFCQSQGSNSESCKLLEEAYRPVLHIKPNAPCCLRISYNASRRRLTWRSTYENYSSNTPLTEYLMYKLQFYKTGDRQWVRTHGIHGTTHTVEDENFEPDTEFYAKVRSSPNMVHYEGQWSDWSAEVVWRTETDAKAVQDAGLMFNLPAVFTVYCTILVLALVLYGSVRKWRQNAFIPTPAPYFHTLYKDCQGDFKSWVITQANTADVLKAEEALRVDSLTECVEAQDERRPAPFQQQFMENRAYSNAPSWPFDGELLSNEALLLDRSGTSLPGYCQSRSPALDSGCWLCSDTSLEPSGYCNEYCTLSCLQEATGGRQGGEHLCFSEHELQITARHAET